MWNLKAYYNHQVGGGEIIVTIIAHYYNPEQKAVYFIAIDEAGKFIDDVTIYFKAIQSKR